MTEDMVKQAEREEQEAAARVAEADRAYAAERTQAAMMAHARALAAWRKASATVGQARSAHYAAMARGAAQ